MSSVELSEREVNFLSAAANYLENPSYLVRLGDKIGRPVQELAKRVMPAKVANVAQTALRKAMGVAIATVPGKADAEDREFREAHETANWTGFWHKMSTVATGFGGGFFGLAGLAIELPITTGIMFRSIAAVAGDLGEDLSDPAVRLECLSVFSQGGPSPDDDAMESSYLTTRLAMSQLIEEAARFLSRQSAQQVAAAFAQGTAPVLLELLARLAVRFNIAVSEKLVVQSMPVIGGITGAALNALFTEHFNTVARYHFGIRKLERLYGKELVQTAYRAEWARLRSALPPAAQCKSVQVT